MPVVAFSTTSSTFSSSTRKLKNKPKSWARHVWWLLPQCLLLPCWWGEVWRIGCLGGDSPIALLSRGKYCSQDLNMQTLQEKAGRESDDIELLRDSQNRLFFARMVAGGKKTGRRWTVMAGSPMSTSSAHSAFSTSTCAHKGPDTKNGKSPPAWWFGSRSEAWGMSGTRTHGWGYAPSELSSSSWWRNLEHCENFSFLH